MNTNLTINDTVIPLNNFTQDCMGNIIRGIVTSLGVNARNIQLLINKESLLIMADCKDVAIKEEFAYYMIKSTVKGMVSSFEDIPWFETISLTITN